MTAPPDHVVIFDTTLRDGEQSPGCSMTQAQKLRMAKVLADLGVDVIEAGFPAASPNDFASVQAIAQAVQETTICGLARCCDADIERTAEALSPAAQARIHVFIATSPIHRKHKLSMSKAEVLERAVAGVTQAKAHVDDVEFSAEDAVRTEPEFLAEVFSAVIAAGATTINVPDTVGYTTPEEMATLIGYLRDNVVGVEKAVISAHCHDDLGMAVANSLAAVKAGARQVECTINGIGERAGNAALEEVVMALKTRQTLYGVATSLHTQRLYAASRMLAGIVGSVIPRNKAIVGENAFAHESGIHQHGMLAHSETYEIMRPQDVGMSTTQLVLGKHSGRHALMARIEELGFELEEDQLAEIFQKFKALADKKKQVFDADVEALVMGHELDQPGPWQLMSLQVSSVVGAHSVPSAVVSLRDATGTEQREAATGDGPLQATFRAIERATGIVMDFQGVRLRSITEGEDAQAEAQVRVHYQESLFTGRGLSTDVVAACAHAYLEVTNRIARIHQIPSRQLAATA